MPKIDKVSWGKVKVDGRQYHQVLIVGDEVMERDKPKLKKLFGTTHKIGDWEQEKLLSDSPEIILIANGWSGILKVDEEFKRKIESAGIELRIVLTPKVIKEYNLLIKEKKQVNALIHTTC
ncbi:hypothetical protein COU96_00940 [Candidatus Shapirobacteria bacterium CG10_big_fil_rev_8_21_14_0_10_38_14]|uniref:Uncharacterized protein n=1 Tax=Candidatus Shapirobacteria bacterium CG10_big_fil_rev_8_21_14_0_10_38_14 TaxID=1974483 RepID=A0A2M8L5X9_9BACT|nr:MAG: hypothetical protein COU96_00940 [Candidatus Shapirobacteria bacterium CG10_big_fil_rev_8_21_14_0_10_38_14]